MSKGTNVAFSLLVEIFVSPGDSFDNLEQTRGIFVQSIEEFLIQAFDIIFGKRVGFHLIQNFVCFEVVPYFYLPVNKCILNQTKCFLIKIINKTNNVLINVLSNKTKAQFAIVLNLNQKLLIQNKLK